jgi:protoheme IX farnesyltransferase
MNGRVLAIVPTAAGVARWRAYLRLCKPKVVALLVFTAQVAMLLAAPPSAPPAGTILAATLGLTLAAASAAAFNHVADREIDALMRRTRNRPLPSGLLTWRQATAFACVTGVAGIAILWLLVNPLTALLCLVGMIGYAVVYTRWLKWIGPQNIVLGGAAGAVPALVGWSAVAGRLDAPAFALFLIVLVWTPPHFWSLAIARRDEYAAAKAPMLPTVRGVACAKRYIFGYTLALFPVSLLPGAAGIAGPLYLVGAVLLSGSFVFRAARLLRSDQDRDAMALFRYSITYLSALFALMLLDHYLRL